MLSLILFTLGLLVRDDMVQLQKGSIAECGDKIVLKAENNGYYFYFVYRMNPVNKKVASRRIAMVPKGTLVQACNPVWWAISEREAFRLGVFLIDVPTLRSDLAHSAMKEHVVTFSRLRAKQELRGKWTLHVPP